jgi:hypothetical protein
MFRSLRKKFAKIALSVMVLQLSLLGVTAVPQTVGAASSVIEINNIAELSSAINGQADGQVWNIHTGLYDLSPAFSATPFDSQPGWYFPITASDLTINGDIDTILTSSVVSPNGAWASQNLITIFGDNVTLNGLTITPKVSENKTVEVLGQNVKIVNCLFDFNSIAAGASSSYGGSLYLNGQGGSLGDIEIINNSFDGQGIVVDSVTGGTVQITGNEFNSYPYYAVGNQTWTSPATLEMTDVYLSGNSFNNVVDSSKILRNRMVGNFIFDDSNTVNGDVLTAELLSPYINYAPHTQLLPINTRLLATVNGTQILLNNGSEIKYIFAYFEGPSELIVEKDSVFNPMKDLVVIDEKDGDISSRVVVSGDIVDTTKLGVYSISYAVNDSAGTEINFARKIIVKDTTAPVVKAVFKPTIVSDLKKGIEVTFTANEKFVIDNFNYSLNSVPFVADLGVTELPQIDNTELNLKHVLFIPGNYLVSEEVVKSLKINFVATDEFSNSTAGAYTEVKVDTVAPLAVKDLKATVAESGIVTLNWTNPENNTDIDYIEVRRDGVFVSTLPATTNSFVDSSTEKGKTYYYEIVLVDKAGNKTVTPRFDVLVPAPVVAAAVSDTVATTPAAANQDAGEVKAETAEDKSSEENKEEEKSEFPVWGIVLLLVLLAVGGYLYWSQKPATIASVAPKAAPAKKSKPKTKKK